MFHTIPQGKEFGADTWEDESWRYTGNANVWTGMSADQNLGYIYLLTGTPTNDWYGGHRLGDNLFAESLVCVDARKKSLALPNGPPRLVGLRFACGPHLDGHRGSGKIHPSRGSGH